MSTYMYLQCLDHNPPLRAEFESGQHVSDLRQIVEDISRRDLLVKAHEMELDSVNQFRRATMRFLAQHPKCAVGVIDEYGTEHFTTAYVADGAIA